MQYRLSMTVQVNVVLNQGMLLTVSKSDVSTTHAVVIFRVNVAIGHKDSKYHRCVSIRAFCHSLKVVLYSSLTKLSVVHS